MLSRAHARTSFVLSTKTAHFLLSSRYPLVQFYHPTSTLIAHVLLTFLHKYRPTFLLSAATNTQNYYQNDTKSSPGNSRFLTDINLQKSLRRKFLLSQRHQLLLRLNFVGTTLKHSRSIYEKSVFENKTHLILAHSSNTVSCAALVISSKSALKKKRKKKCKSRCPDVLSLSICILWKSVYRLHARYLCQGYA